MHRDYRLWLTAMPSDGFPVSILQNSVKMTSEPPRGVKANLNVAYLGFSDEYFERQPKAAPFKKLLFGTCFFHALLQDRRKFGPLGFNIRYEFTESDLKCSILQLEKFLSLYDHVPYEVLVNLVGHINYGGRITDDWDRRMVMTVLMSIINPGILSDDYPLAPGDKYLSPGAGGIDQYRETIRGLPINPHPNIFGLHENADITTQQNETQELCDILLSLQPKVSSGGGKSRDDIVRDVAVGLQERALKPFPMDEISSRYPLAYEESMNTVLTQECIRYNKLIKKYNQTLIDILKALKGLVVMSGELEDMANSLFTNQVPALWTKVAYPSLKPLSAWVDELVARIKFIQGWVDSGAPPAFWVSGFFFQQAFLTGTLQNYARKYQVAIDSVSFGFHVLDSEGPDIETKPEDGCYIYGLFLEGAAWDPKGHSLCESAPKELFMQFPAIWLEPITNREKPTSGVYSCPVYKTLVRAGTLSTTGHSTNFVLMAEIPSKEPCEGLFHQYCEGFSTLWVKRAVALFTSLNY
jgi:dynein heavy chain